MESEERHPSAQIVERLAEVFDIPASQRKFLLRFAQGDWSAGRRPEQHAFGAAVAADAAAKRPEAEGLERFEAAQLIKPLAPRFERQQAALF